MAAARSPSPLSLHLFSSHSHRNDSLGPGSGGGGLGSSAPSANASMTSLTSSASGSITTSRAGSVPASPSPRSPLPLRAAEEPPAAARSHQRTTMILPHYHQQYPHQQQQQQQQQQRQQHYHHHHQSNLSSSASAAAKLVARRFSTRATAGLSFVVAGATTGSGSGDGDGDGTPRPSKAADRDSKAGPPVPPKKPAFLLGKKSKAASGGGAKVDRDKVDAKAKAKRASLVGSVESSEWVQDEGASSSSSWASKGAIAFGKRRHRTTPHDPPLRGIAVDGPGSSALDDVGGRTSALFSRLPFGNTTASSSSSSSSSSSPSHSNRHVRKSSTGPILWSMRGPRSEDGHVGSTHRSSSSRSHSPSSAPFLVHSASVGSELSAAVKQSFESGGDDGGGGGGGGGSGGWSRGSSPREATSWDMLKPPAGASVPSAYHPPALPPRLVGADKPDFLETLNGADDVSWSATAAAAAAAGRQPSPSQRSLSSTLGHAGGRRQLHMPPPAPGPLPPPRRHKFASPSVSSSAQQGGGVTGLLSAVPSSWSGARGAAIVNNLNGLKDAVGKKGWELVRGGGERLGWKKGASVDWSNHQFSGGGGGVSAIREDEVGGRGTGVFPDGSLHHPPSATMGDDWTSWVRAAAPRSPGPRGRSGSASASLASPASASASHGHGHGHPALGQVYGMVRSPGAGPGQAFGRPVREGVLRTRLQALESRKGKGRTPLPSPRSGGGTSGWESDSPRDARTPTTPAVAVSRTAPPERLELRLLGHDLGHGSLGVDADFAATTAATDTDITPPPTPAKDALRPPLKKPRSPIPSPGGGVGKRGTFGVSPPSRRLLTSEEARRRYLAAVAARCLDHLDRWAPLEEGIYRVSGRSSHTGQLRGIFDAGHDMDLLDKSPADLDINSVVSVFKQYLRELPEHLLTVQLAPSFDAVCMEHLGQRATSIDALAFVAATKAIEGDDESLAKELALLVRQLPAVNFYLLREIADHLGRLADHVATTKMPLSNLCLVLGPSMLLTATMFRVLVEHRAILFAVGCELDTEIEALDAPPVPSPAPSTSNPPSPSRIAVRSERPSPSLPQPPPPPPPPPKASPALSSPSTGSAASFVSAAPSFSHTTSAPAPPSPLPARRPADSPPSTDSAAAPSSSPSSVMHAFPTMSTTTTTTTTTTTAAAAAASGAGSSTSQQTYHPIAALYSAESKGGMPELDLRGGQDKDKDKDKGKEEKVANGSEGAAKEVVGGGERPAPVIPIRHRSSSFFSSSGANTADRRKVFDEKVMSSSRPSSPCPSISASAGAAGTGMGEDGQAEEGQELDLDVHDAVEVIGSPQSHSGFPSRVTGLGLGETVQQLFSQQPSSSSSSAPPSPSASSSK